MRLGPAQLMRHINANRALLVRLSRAQLTRHINANRARLVRLSRAQLTRHINANRALLDAAAQRRQPIAVQRRQVGAWILPPRRGGRGSAYLAYCTFVLAAIALLLAALALLWHSPLQ